MVFSWRSCNSLCDTILQVKCPTGGILLLRSEITERIGVMGGLRLFRGFIFGFFLKRFPGGFIADKAFLIGLFLAGRHKPRLAFWKYGVRFMLKACSWGFVGVSLYRITAGRLPLQGCF